MKIINTFIDKLALFDKKTAIILIKDFFYDAEHQIQR